MKDLIIIYHKENNFDNFCKALEQELNTGKMAYEKIEDKDKFKYIIDIDIEDAFFLGMSVKATWNYLDRKDEINKVNL